MALNSSFLPKGKAVIKLPSRASRMIILSAVIICSIYLSFFCLKQTQHTENSSYNYSVKKHAQIKSEVSIVNPSQPVIMIKGSNYVQKKPIIMSKGSNYVQKEAVVMSAETVNQKLLNVEQKNSGIKKYVAQSHDRRITGLKDTKVQVKLVPRKRKPVDRIQIQVKREDMNNNLTQVPCPKPKLPQSELPYLHYPVPKYYSRRECACNPVRFYVIISMQRSGSKWLESLLNSHINVSSNGEIFQDRERSANVSALKSTLDTVFNLDWRHSTQKKACMGAVGFKWMLNQRILENREEILKYFNHRHVSVIFLFRRNLLRRMISLIANRDNFRINGTHKAHVITKQEADMLASYKPKMNAKLLIQILKHDSELADRAVESLKSIRHMVLYYEDLVHNNTEKLSEVVEFLRLPRRKMSSQHVKIHTKPLSELVRNWNSVQKVLSRSQFSDFLKPE